MTTHVLGTGLPAETAPEGFTYLTIIGADAGSYSRTNVASESISMCRRFFIEDFGVDSEKTLKATT